MMLFQAASDETKADGKTLIYGGFVASADDWSTFFAPAWNERVVAPYLHNVPFHTVDLMSHDWCRDRGLALHHIDSCLDEAASVIRASGFLRLLTCRADQPHFESQFRSTRIVRVGSRQPALDRFPPDLMCFLGFAHQLLHHIHHEYPAATKVDFIIERGPLTANLKRLHDHLHGSLDEAGLPELASLVGEFVPDGKGNALLQAADFACWHVQRAATRFRLPNEYRRYRAVVDRLGSDYAWEMADIEGFAKRAEAETVPSPFPPRTRRTKPEQGAVSQAATPTDDDTQA